MCMFVYTFRVASTRRASKILPTREARESLTRCLKIFRAEGAEAEPVFFGAHRKPEAVVLSYQAYEELMDALDDVLIADQVAKRDKTDSGERIELADLIRSQGFDPAEFGVE
jgi:PHD/YefM family antitoxin component YafN of YafNO toxin-antitoxin module